MGEIKVANKVLLKLLFYLKWSILIEWK
jgi:hypothetical protein